MGLRRRDGAGDGLHLDVVLLGVVEGEILVEEDDGAVAVGGGEHEGLPVWCPGERERNVSE